jgi:hypothetical protein
LGQPVGFFCVVWNVYVRELAAELRWILLAVLLRATGVRVGRGVVLDGRFAEGLPDPDMITSRTVRRSRARSRHTPSRTAC